MYFEYKKEMPVKDTEWVEYAAKIIMAFVSNNALIASDLPKLLAAVHGALLACEHGGAAGQSREEDKFKKPNPSQVEQSITPDALISFIDRNPYKMLKRHLRRHGLDPDSYRARYGLPADYPMTAQSYSGRRSEIARSMALGRQRRKWPAKGDKETTDGA